RSSRSNTCRASPQGRGVLGRGSVGRLGRPCVIGSRTGALLPSPPEPHDTPRSDAQKSGSYRASVPPTEARNGTGHVDVQQTCPTRGEVVIHQKPPPVLGQAIHRPGDPSPRRSPRRGRTPAPPPSGPRPRRWHAGPPRPSAARPRAADPGR